MSDDIHKLSWHAARISLVNKLCVELDRTIADRKAASEVYSVEDRRSEGERITELDKFKAKLLKHRELELAGMMGYLQTVENQ